MTKTKKKDTVLKVFSKEWHEKAQESMKFVCEKGEIPQLIQGSHGFDNTSLMNCEGDMRRYLVLDAMTAEVCGSVFSKKIPHLGFFIGTNDLSKIIYE